MLISGNQEPWLNARVLKWFAVRAFAGGKTRTTLRLSRHYASKAVCLLRANKNPSYALGSKWLALKDSNLQPTG